MPRRTASAVALATPAASTPLRDLSALPTSDDPFHVDVALLRRQWKWAAFSQFFYTFATLFAMPDVTLTDIEDDLTRSTSMVLPRIMHRLLYTLSPDRRLTLENWQTSLRKQYAKRDPQANPIGPEPVVSLPTPSPEPEEQEREQDEEPKEEPVQSAKPESRTSVEPSREETKTEDASANIDTHVKDKDSTLDPSLSRAETELRSLKAETRATSSIAVEEAPKGENEPVEESKDWLQLPMLEKLNSMWLLTEWQFHKPARFRQLMRDDDETAQWRIEPIGYDSKSNAYWLIGSDRLWIQRVPPKPPKTLKRKRPAAKSAASKKSKRPPPVSYDDEFSDAAPTPSPKKRKAAPTALPSNGKTPVRSTRKRGAAAVAVDETPSGRGSRAAKTQANVKLDLQAKELAELKRQAAIEGKKGRRGSAAAADGDADGEFSGSAAPTRSSPRKTRGPPPATPGTRTSARLRGSGRRNEDEEWQEIPDEWLMEGVEDGKTEGGKGKGKVLETVVVPKTGLESDDDSVSELTELSEPDEPEEDAEEEEKPVAAKSKRAPNGKGGRKSARTKRGAAVKDEAHEPEPEPAEDTEPVEEAEPEWRPPDDFVEWETLCVTLPEWEHIAERFEKATHYTEKALYKVLSQHIVPSIVEELREIERKKRLEEAVSHRKRSSRLAMKETEKEEHRLAIQRQAEEEEKMGRARRAEARARKEEEEREKRESAREKRRRDREEREERNRQREMARAEGGASSSAVSTPIDVEADESPAPASRARKPARPSRPSAPKAVVPATGSGSRTPSSTEDWELDCEVCFRHGINKDDGAPLLCCGRCGKWQHIACHDYADRAAGRKKRNWDVEEFICKRCRSSAYATMQHNGSARGYPSGYAQPSGSGQIPYGSYGQGQPNLFARGDAYNQPLPASSSAPSRTHPSHAAITFAHYQPQQQGFSRTPVAQAQPFTPTQGYPSSNYGVDPSTASRSVTDHHNSMNARNGERNTPQPVASFAHRPYVPNGSSWPSSVDGTSHQPPHQHPHPPVHQPVHQPAGAAAAWNAPPLNGYGHYNPSAERSSSGRGPSYDRTSLPPPSHVPAHAPSSSQQWQQSYPAARQVQPQAGPAQAMNTNAYPSSAQEQYHYSAGSVLPHAQHRGP